MPRFYAFKQFGPNEVPVRVHKVAIPLVTEPGFYRAVGTLNAFCHGHRADRNNFWALHPKTAKVHNLRARKPTHKFWYHGERWEEWQDNLTREFWAHERNLPVIEHASMWDFYKHIGFDYKTGKWTKGLIRKRIKVAKKPY